MKIFPLSEGAFTIDKTKFFVPFNPQKDELQKRPIGSLLVEVQPFVVITTNDVILLDTGLGFSRNNQLQLHENLIKNGIAPESVTKVLLSHLHKDHAGGICKKDKLGNVQLAFKNATYFIQKSEFDFAMFNNTNSYMNEEFEILLNNKQVVWLNGNGSIENFITYEQTCAHSPYHQVFWIKENNETIFFGADDAPQLQQMKTKFVAKYDFDGKKTMQLRKHWWQIGNKEKWKFLFYHDTKTPVYHQL